MSSQKTRAERRSVSASARSVDAFLGGRIDVVQPRRGHRAGSDAVFLAAAVPARPGESVLDVGAGVGVAGLCLLVRVPGLDVTAVEIDEELCELASKNAERNEFAASFRVAKADVMGSAKSHREAGLVREAYDHVIANPPFYAEAAVRAAPDKARASAHVMGAGGLASWLRFLASYAAPKGRLTLIHRPECLGELLSLLERRFGDVTVFPLFPKQGDAASRIIVQGRKGSRTGVSLLPGLVLHKADGRYTDEAEAVLRGGSALPIGKN
ncbi:MAG: tRNA1(Val) (adenine(37)-N6)-methyltransferase [Actinomycetota bacterium]